ncbi:unnamed protein product [Caenorhabditis auriculariae]|uniref:Phospholipase A(2) n=1 Tax=Caenorhabditis auriculariae TaxID=2777116 RepID=A0A8S1H2L9_9PELO|nr:unnamed protein product [Caenorhabditis auriculariae]
MLFLPNSRGFNWKFCRPANASNHEVQNNYYGCSRNNNYYSSFHHPIYKCTLGVAKYSPNVLLLRDVVNGCCYVHDACYDAQNGQKLCDDNFCNCLELATRPSTACHNESSPVFCDLVRTFGDDAYLNSGPNATIIVDEEKNDAEKDYDYETAVKKNLTLF